MVRTWGRWAALVMAVVAAVPVQAQAQDQDARSAIMALKAEIQRLRSDMAVLQARVDREERIIAQSATGLQIGNPDIERITITTKTGSVLFDRNMLTINARNLYVNGDRFELGGQTSILIRSDTILLDARVVNVKGDGSSTIKGLKVQGN